MTHDELDLVVIGQVMAGCFLGKFLTSQASPTQCSTTGMSICQKTFLFLHYTMDYGCFKASYMASGVTARVHGNKGKQKKLGLSLKEIQDVVQFIMSYAGACIDL